MSAFNIVRFRVKPGRQQDFVDYHRGMRPAFKGFKRGAIIKTGENTFCFIGEWASFQKIVDARPMMIGLLDGMRGMLEDLGNGVTDPVSGAVALELRVAKPKAKKAKSKKSAAKKANAKPKRK